MHFERNACGADGLALTVTPVDSPRLHEEYCRAFQPLVVDDLRQPEEVRPAQSSVERWCQPATTLVRLPCLSLELLRF